MGGWGGWMEGAGGSLGWREGRGLTWVETGSRHPNPLAWSALHGLLRVVAAKSLVQLGVDLLELLGLGQG